MRAQIWIIGGSFVLFGLIALVMTKWSPSYLGLIVMGVVAILMGYFWASD
jgi:hydrogenase/urease accessory protein HupE